MTAPIGIITDQGRVLMARLLRGDSIGGITHVAIGDGNTSFTDPHNPPAPSPSQTGLLHERARKRFHKRSYLAVDPTNQASLIVDGVHYTESASPTGILGVFFTFAESEANGITIKEYGFFGGGVAYRPGVSGDLALNGVFSSVFNPYGQVASGGYLYEVKNVEDKCKSADMRVDIVCVIKL